MNAQTKTADRTSAKQQAPQQAPTGNLPAQAEPRGKPPIVQFREYVEARMATLEDALPPHIAPQKFVSVLMTALQNKPKLLECTFPSLWNACVRAAQDGLLPDGREGAIAPYGENVDGKRVAEIATWMPMIEGFRKKIFETGKVKLWEVEVVREKDEFEYERGDKAFLHHRPMRLGFEDPGRIVGAWSRAELLDGSVVYEVMSAYEIAQIAAKSKSPGGPWKDAAFFGEMCKKVVARRHYKQLPHSESLSDMLRRDDETFGLADDQAPPIPARPAPRRIASREAFDQYAGVDRSASMPISSTGQTIEHDANGEVTDGTKVTKEFVNETLDKTRRGAGAQVADPAAPGASKEAAAATGNATAAASINQVADPSGEKTGASGASKEAGATTGNAPVASASTNKASNDLPEETLDGADRPWPPGATPTTLAEYKRYQTTSLAALTKAGEVAPWFNSEINKQLRFACGAIDVEFEPLQKEAMARRRALG
jgi:recombination protein RecT